MNHGGVAYISEDKCIRLSEDLLKPLSIAKGSQLTGIYYPTPTGENAQAYQGAPFLHDFMLTPIPFRAWPYSAGIRVDIYHQRGAFADVTAFLKEWEINIISAECTRSGHRHASWNMVVEFHGLRKEFGQPSLDELQRLSEALQAETKKLKTEIVAACKSAIPDPATTPYLRNPIGAWPLKGLAYFYEYSEKHPSLARPFTAICRDQMTIDIGEVPHHVWSKIKGDLPTLGFASMETDLFNIRVAVLERSTLRRFRSVALPYVIDRSSELGSSFGLLHAMSDELRADWNLWRVYTQTWRESPVQEEGLVQLFIEHHRQDRRQASHPDEIIDKSLLSRLEAVLARFGDLGYQGPIRVSSISPRRIFISIRNESDFSRREDVIRICRERATKFGILPEDIVTVSSLTAESVTNEVGDAIRCCSGMLQFYMGTAVDSSLEWLSGEFFLACFLKRPCVRFVDPKLKERLKVQLDHPARMLPTDVSEAELARAIEEGFAELVEKMPW